MFLRAFCAKMYYRLFVVTKIILRIYLHDSPSRSLFEKENRAFSSGCVRVEDAGKLARYLLRTNWSGQMLPLKMV
ncbi:MAG: L,D-transpeptidase family protein [Fimbriimonadaceae bacterium]|nr:L,D-transpeptidase family protein [Chitinophagales bacterium]